MSKAGITFVATACAVLALAGPSRAQTLAPYLSGAVVGTKAGGCGASLGEYAFIQYSAHDAGASMPAKLLIQTEGSTVYVENKALTDEFSGSGKLVAPVILNFASAVGSFPALAAIKAAGSYSVTLDASDPDMIKLDPMKITLNIPDLGLCQFNYRGVVTPSPVPVVK